MLKESPGQTQSKEAILNAINALKARGATVNAYSVAIESDIPRSLIVGDVELMGLIASTAAADGDQDAEVQRLRRELKENQTELFRLNTQVSAQKLEAQKSAKSTQIAWQQGYLAGQEAAFDEEPSPKSLVESLAEAAEASTTYGDDDEPAANSKMSQAAEHLQQPALSDADLQQSQSPVETIVTFVADVPLNISDPEVLNDPFTAKLLQALQPDAEDGEDDNGVRHISPKYEDITVTNIVIPQDQALTAEPPDSIEYRAVSDGPVDEHGAQLDTDDLPPPAASEHEHDELRLKEPMPDLEISTNFTADELHSLFRNRYAKPEEAPPEPVKPVEPAPAAAAASGPYTAKKFVGAKAASSEPLPNLPRVFPPEIRKACKLLGLNPEELSRATVLEAWKAQMAKPGVHPDTGGDTEMAIYLNTAKDTLMRWVESQTPKLGKKFGQQSKAESPKPQPKPE